MNVIREVLSHFHLPLLSCFGLLLFMGVFTGALMWVFRKGSGEFYAKLSDLPLDLIPQDGER
ncbi:MAG: cbb3-type cytochrome c oxidase subunit 3 [Bdellovibrionia bacterium]